MVSWTKCWARKSHTYVKNLGNIRVGNLQVSAGKKSAEYLYRRLIRYLTSIASRAFVFYFNAVISTMEFPPETYDVFEADQFESARVRLTGDAVMEVMLQMRPNGRYLDHYRIALDGTVLETQVVATNVFRVPVLAKYRLTYQARPRDLKIRRNRYRITTSGT
jgi:hypothetical protein